MHTCVRDLSDLDLAPSLICCNSSSYLTSLSPFASAGQCYSAYLAEFLGDSAGLVLVSSPAKLRGSESDSEPQAIPTLGAPHPREKKVWHLMLLFWTPTLRGYWEDRLHHDGSLWSIGKLKSREGEPPAQVTEQQGPGTSSRDAPIVGLRVPKSRSSLAGSQTQAGAPPCPTRCGQPPSLHPRPSQGTGQPASPQPPR